MEGWSLNGMKDEAEGRDDINVMLSLQLNGPVVEGSADVRSDGVEGQPLHSS